MRRVTSAAWGLAHWLVAAALVAIGSMITGAAKEWERMVSLSNGQKIKEDGFLGEIGSYPHTWKKSEVSDENKDVLSDLKETSEDLKFRMKIWEIEDRQRKEFREAVSKLMKAAGHE